MQPLPATCLVAEQVNVPLPRATRGQRSLPAHGGQAEAGGPCFGGRYLAGDLVGQLPGARLWRGTDAVLNRTVTIWAPPAGRPVSLEVITAVLAAARLSDSRIARIFDADCAADRPYVITEWTPGAYLDDSLATGLPDPWTAATVALAAAGALCTAHDAGLPHLCLTPRSVRWSRNGLKLTGLGIEAALTGTHAADPLAADTRSLGGLLYALLTGYWPGAGASRLPAAPTRDGAPCSPGQLRAGLPAAFDAITARVLGSGADSAGGQIRTPAEFGWELRKARRELTSATGSRTPRRATPGCAGSASAAPSHR